MLKKRNMFREHGFKLFRVVEIINMLMQSLRDILETFPNITQITVIAIYFVN